MDDLNPITRTERLLDGEDLTPTNREEMFIRRIYDKTQEIPEPVNRKEYFLKKAGEAGGDVTVVPLSVTDNGTYSEEGKAYSPVTVAVEPPEGSYQLKSITTPTSLATFNASAMPMPKLKASIVAKQASGTPSPSNPLPISGWDAVVVTIKDDVDNPTVTQTTTISLGQTVYGGELDVVNGTSGNKVTYGFVDLSTLTGWDKGNNDRFFTSALSDVIADTTSLSTAADLMCSHYGAISFNEANTRHTGIYEHTNKSIGIYNESMRDYTVEQFLAAISGVQLRYPLATPTTLTTQPTPIKSLNGQNNLSVDSGEVIEGEYFIALGGE